MGKTISFDDLTRVHEWHPGRSIAHCHGVFDLFHIGHLAHLNSAKRFGDILVVTVTKDRFVNKGPHRPRYSELERASMLAALEIVDYVAINEFPHGTEPIEKLRPDFYVKGPDYQNLDDDITGRIREEKTSVEAGGGKLVFTEDETESSTELLNAYFSQWDQPQQDALERVKDSLSLDAILKIIDSFSELKVLVIGEPIVDTYVFCRPENLSTKSPTVSAQLLRQEDYAGGALAIANQLGGLGCKTSLLFTHGGEPYFQELLSGAVNKSVQLLEHVISEIPTPRKTRYLTDKVVPQRIFELFDVRADQWLLADCEPFRQKMLGIADSFDVVIAADFGHGIFEGPVKESLSDIKPFFAVNVQTNSANLGFNPFTKHEHYDYLCIDRRECRLGMHDRFTPSLELARKAVADKIKRHCSVTLSEDGSTYFDGQQKEYTCPAFFTEVIDTTGAGDAYFTVTSLLAKLDAPGSVVPFLGNIYAGLKSRIVGHRSTVSKIDLVRTVSSMLK